MTPILPTFGSPPADSPAPGQADLAQAASGAVFAIFFLAFASGGMAAMSAVMLAVGAFGPALLDIIMCITAAIAWSVIWKEGRLP